MCYAMHNMLHFQRFCHHSRSQDGDWACDLDHSRPALGVGLTGDARRS